MRWIFSLIALVVGLVAHKKERAVMRFPETKFFASAAPCPIEKYQDWFKELRRLACYPNDYTDRLDGVWGPLQVKDKAHE